MKRIFTLISVLLALAINANVYSQSKFGNATMDEMQMSVYSNDTTASAVVLLKEGDTRFVYTELYGFQFEYTLKMKIKILKTEALDWCNHEISYYEHDSKNKEKIISLSGATYTLQNGKIEKTKLSKEYISDEDVDGKWKLKKFTLPGAKVGSVIEFKYTIVSDFFHEFRDFNFQTSIPTAYVYYEVVIPEYFSYNVNMQGYETIQANKKSQNMSFHVVYTNNAGRKESDMVNCSADKYEFKGVDIPAIKSEPRIWTLNDYISKVSFELKSTQFPFSTVKFYSSDWKKVDEQLFESGLFGGNLKKTGLFKDDIKPAEQTLEKAREIQNSIKYKVKWDGVSKFYPSNLGNVLKSGMGSSADMNFLLINALKAGGFDAFPVVLSRRDRGRLPLANASINALNYVITGMQIDTITYFTDASAKYGDWNLLPEKCMVDNARALIQGRSSWVDLTNLSNTLSVRTAVRKYTEGKCIIDVSETRRGNTAYNYKSIYYEKHKDKEEFVEKLGAKLGGAIKEFKTTDIDNTDKDLKVNYLLEIDEPLEDEFIYINPMLEKHFQENPFKSEQRKFPIAFEYPYNYRQIYTIMIPEGYAVEELPKSERFTTDGDVLSLTYRMLKDDAKIVLQYTFQQNKIFFLPDEYEILKDFFGKVVLKNSEQIVLKKISQ